MADLNRAATADDILVSLHPRRLGIIGDGQSGDPSALILDGQVIGSKRFSGGLLVQAITAVAAGAITLTGARVGDAVVSVTDLTTPGNGAAKFETTISVKDQIQQLSASTDVFLVCLRANS